MLEFGAVQIGVMAAGIVLFVPMGMAGWRLSRNKMLFCSGALFITLAVAVHLTPYLLSPSSSSSSKYSIFISPPPLVKVNRDSCFSFLHHIIFHLNASSDADASDLGLVSWDWATANPSCDFHRVGLSDASDLLNGSWIVVAGDSQSRCLALSLLHLLLNSQDFHSAQLDFLDKRGRHSNYQFLIPGIGMKLDFIWAPFVPNLTHLLNEFNQNGTYPDVLVVGSGLWHMLHLTNHSDYALSLQLLRSSLLQKLPQFASHHHLFWLGMPLLINPMLNSVDKRDRMTPAAFHAYEKELYNSELLRHFLLLDMHSLSRTCGSRCTLDGMHYHHAVYEAALHIMLNALLIQSHQKLL